MAVATPRARRVRRARPFRHVTFTLGLAITPTMIELTAPVMMRESRSRPN